MPISTLLALTRLQPSAPPDLDARLAAITASAAAHHDAGAYAAAADDYLTLAALPGADSETALKQAHLNLDAAFVSTRDPHHLCRALSLAQRRLAAGRFKSDQARLSWAETADDDAARLAAAGGTASCPPPPVSPVKLLEADTPAGPRPPPARPARVSPIEIEPASPRRSDRAAERRLRARTAAGATLTGLGLGFGGLMGLTVALHAQQLAALRRANDVPDGFTYSAEDRRTLTELHDDAQRTRTASIGLGVASAAALGVGIGLLASGRRASRALALAPHGGAHGGGLTFRLRF